MRGNSQDLALRSGRREAAVALGIWLCALIYSVTYCYLFGYRPADGQLHFVIGIPSWVFWGIIAPWLACVALSWWFSFYFMRDDDIAAEGTADASPTDSRGGD
jgi:hypothetical protein